MITFLRTLERPGSTRAAHTSTQHVRFTVQSESQDISTQNPSLSAGWRVLEPESQGSDSAGLYISITIYSVEGI